MGWRRGELWFDMEFLWFRERAADDGALFALNAPSFLAFAAAGELDVAVPDGLSASRRRRADRRRRRHARRTRAAAALVVAPAAVLTLSGQRLGTGSAGGALQADPPSMTSQRSGPQTTPRASARPSRPQQQSSEPRMPAFRWREATSYGLPYRGSLSGGTQLPLEGPDWVTWNPVTDSVPNAPGRLFGHERTIRRVAKAIAAYRSANPGAPRVVVGDISFRGGGPMELHRSHQNGLDVDVYYPRRDARERTPTTSGEVDRRLAQELLDAFLAVGAQVVFVGYSTDLRGPGGVVVPYPNHEDHLHVRFGRPG